MGRIEDWVGDVKRDLGVANGKILELVKFSRDYAKQKRIRLFLVVRWCSPQCQSCPHGPYWAKGWKGKDTKWKEEEVMRITKEGLRSKYKEETVKDLLGIGKRAEYLRAMKEILTQALARTTRICSSASSQYAKMLRNFEEGNFRELGKQVSKGKYRRKGI